MDIFLPGERMIEIFRDIKSNDELENLNLTLKKNKSLLLLKTYEFCEKKMEIDVITQK